MLNPRFLTAAALLSAMLTAIPVAAGAAETRSVTVRSGDLNLAKDAGRTVLQQRIAHAVDVVCGPHARTTADIQAYATCSKTARASATSQFNAMVANAQAGKKVVAGGGAATSAE
jgi:UrcA family protein